MLRFYGPVNPLGSCRVRSIHLTTLLHGRLRPLSGYQYCTHYFARNWQLPFLNQWKGENDHRKYFMINLKERMLPARRGWICNLLITSRRHIQLSHQGLLSCALYSDVFFWSVQYPMALYANNEDRDHKCSDWSPSLLPTARIWHNVPFLAWYIIYVMAMTQCLPDYCEHSEIYETADSN